MSKRQLSIDVETGDGVSVVTLTGAIDASNASDFARVLDRVCAGETPRVVVDCAELIYVNSTSFGLFFKYHRVCEKHGGGFAICSVRRKILNIINLLGLDKFLDMHSDQKAAITHLQRAVRS